MASAAAYSYEHPRRIRAFPTSAEKRKSPINDENEYPSASVLRRLEESISRLEYTTNEKISALFSRMDKCSDLSVASSRAVAALSNQFDELKTATEKQLGELIDAVDDVRSGTSRLCSESQTLTMTAIEDCCSELVKQIKSNSESIRKSGDSWGHAESLLRGLIQRNSEELIAVKTDLRSVSDRLTASSQMTEALTEEMRFVAEESVNSCLREVKSQFSKDLESFDLDWRDYRDNLEQKLLNIERRMADDKRLEDLRNCFEERMKSASSSMSKDVESKLADAKKTNRKELSELKKDLASCISERSPPVPESVFKNIASEVEQVKSIMALFSADTVPAMYREVEMRIAQCEHHTQQHSLDLLKEFATEFEFDIDRMVELVHSVYVQGNMPMPAGTSASWRRFKEVMFDKENFGGVRVRRPILDTSSHRSRRSR